MNRRNYQTPISFAATAMAGLMIPSLVANAAAPFISEPETLVFGKIVNRQNPNLDQLVAEGELKWSIKQSDGSTVELIGEVDQLDGGRYSYFLRIPHQAMMLGQELSGLTLPLGTSESRASHVSITLDGQTAGILPPATSAISFDQVLRASAWRLDLEVDLPTVDSDEDGMPDWWEDENGLDKQDPQDALGDLNHDGLNNLAAFMAGQDPAADSKTPKLITREVIAYSSSESIVLLEVADSDSTAAQLSFTLHSLPDGGRLVMRNSARLPQETDQPLAVGSTFSHEDVLSGRLVFQHADGQEVGEFEVGVKDEDPDHGESRGEVLVRLFDPPTEHVAADSVESIRLEAHRLAKGFGHLAVDLGASAGAHRLIAASSGLSESEYQAHITSFGEERSHIFIGGPAADSFVGGPEADFFFGGEGDDSLRGHAGADSFLFAIASDGEDEILDFDPEEGDLVDLTGVLNGASLRLTDYVRIRRDGQDALIEVDADGGAAGFTDLVIRLRDSVLEASDVADLYYAGNIEAGEVGLPPRLSIAADAGGASENGPKEGKVTITREGDLSEPLLISFHLSGNASNGIDFEYLPDTVIIPANTAGVSLRIRPYVDAVVEYDEVLFIGLSDSPDYLLGEASGVQVMIEDLKPQFSLEVIEGLASVDDSSPASLLVRRGGLLSPEVFVQFSLAGSAVNGIDYEHLSPHLTFTEGQTTRIIEFVPKPEADFGGAEAKSIRMTVKPDASYAVLTGDAEMALVPEKVSFKSWLVANDLPEDAGTGVWPPDNRDGTPLIMRYGFASQKTDPGGFSTRDRMPIASLEDGYLTLRFRRKPGLTDLTYQVEYSNDLQEWFSGSEQIEDITSIVAPDDPGASVFRAKTPMDEEAVGAMRVRLVLPDSDGAE